jgi:hypothetical protein
MCGYWGTGWLLPDQHVVVGNMGYSPVLAALDVFRNVQGSLGGRCGGTVALNSRGTHRATLICFVWVRYSGVVGEETGRRSRLTIIVHVIRAEFTT